MGCAQSRIDNEESVARCKERRILMKEALLARSHFAVAHSGYAIALRHAGSALSDYAHGESSPEPHSTSTLPPPVEVKPPPPLPPQEPLPPPPPPLPTFNTPSPNPLQRSVTMPEFSKRGVSRMGSLSGLGEEEEEGGGGVKIDAAWDYFDMSPEHPGLGEIDEENEEEQEEEERDNGDVQFKTPEKVSTMEEGEQGEDEVVGIRQFVHSNTAPAEVVGKMSVGTSSKVEKGGNGDDDDVSKVNLMKVIEEIDECFLKASECAQEVTKLLEAHKLKYHSTYADDNRVPVDHAARVMRVITWNRTLRGTPEGGKDDNEDNETLATVLDKLMAWEKKLYEEVKASEMMKLEYHRKVSLLNRQKKRSANPETLEKTKAAVSHLHTRYIVDMQSMDSTVSEVNELRDQQLYPKLVELINGMAKMWENIRLHHETQLSIATELKTLDVSMGSRVTSEPHHQCTLQLANVVQQWQEQFETLVNHQKHFVHLLNRWLKLNLIPIESSLKEKITSSPPRSHNPPIQSLLLAWHDYLEKLPDEDMKTAITSYAAMIRTIILHQEEEMKLRESCEELRKEFLRKSHAFEEWYQKQTQRKGPEFAESERAEDNAQNPLSERRFVVDSLKKRLDDETEKYQRHCVQVREKSLGTLKTRLPELFRALLEYAHSSSDACNRLRAIVLSHNSNRGPS